MQCSKCRKESIVYQPYSGQHLCRDHFINDLEAKVKRGIRVHQWMRPGDHIGVPTAGDSAGRALLFFLDKLTGNRRDIRVSVIPACGGGIAEYLERARDSGITKIAIATTLEDAAASALADILQGNAGRHIPDSDEGVSTLPLITPLSHIPAEEMAVYARIHGITEEKLPCPQKNDSLYTHVKAMLIDYSKRHPAAPHAVLNLSESLTLTCRKADKELPHGA
jgi:hypothetical protein